LYESQLWQMIETLLGFMNASASVRNRLLSSPDRSIVAYRASRPRRPHRPVIGRSAACAVQRLRYSLVGLDPRPSVATREASTATTSPDAPNTTPSRC